MRGKNIVLINGRSYDALTGLPSMQDIKSVTPTAKNLTPQKKPAVFSDISPSNARQPLAAPTVQKPSIPIDRQNGAKHASVHRQLQKSQTLYRAALKRPSALVKAAPPPPTKSPMISKFASHPKVAQAKPAAPPSKVVTEPTIVARPVAEPRQSDSKPNPNKNSNSLLKARLIKERIAEAEARKGQHKRTSKTSKLKRFMGRHSKLANAASITLALLVIGGYITYINLPNLSVRVAAARAGINATYPEYKPDGYGFSGPVAYAPSEITLGFQSNSNSEQTYQIKQRASTWDSQAVLDNLVDKETDTYLTYSERGLTVYTYDQKAAWVNGGILYTLDGNAPLSSDQILRIASSL